MSVRGLNDTLKASLISEDPFLYAHLVKFERIVKTVSSKPSKTATDYSYITDAATDISYDDGSEDVHENLNGSQTYIANRLLKVGSVNETTEAKASSLTIDIASIALDTKVEGQVLDFIGNVNADTVQINLDATSTGYEDDFVERGFTEGDKVTITHVNNTNTDLHNRQCIITSFASNNKTMHCTTILGSDGIQAITPSNLHNTSDYTLTLSTDEVVGALNDPDDTTYAAYINREVFIYKTHINPDTNATIGVPYLIFKGIIAKVKLSEDPSKSSTVKWTLTSHWGDFNRVNGRITSDEEHRALGVNRRPDTASLHRNEYAYDFGFKHSEQAINIISIYQVMETRYKMKKSGWIFKKYKMKEYEVEVDKDVDLRFNLHAKHLPVLYGVNKTDSIPIFADTLKNDPSKIYVVYAICEGEVSGIYDMYIDDQSRICIDKNDSDTRSTQTAEDTIDVVCEGRMDRGDTLSSSPAFTSALTDFLSDYSYNWDGRGVGGIGAVDWRSLGVNLAANFTQNGDTGVTHEKQNTFEFPIKARAIFHAGRSHQRSDDMLTRIGTEKVGGNIVGGFKLQQDMEDEDKTSYWDSNFRLLDTAYLVVEYEIAEGDVTIPEIDFVVRGREVQQYNYDYSYREISNPIYANSVTSATQRAKFKIGDLVDVYEYATNSPALAQNIQIVDLYKYVDARETTHWKFRFASNPLVKSDGTTSSTTNFYMVPDGTASSSNDRFHFATWDDKAVSGNVGATLRHAIDTNAGNTATGTVAANSGATGIDITDLSTTLQRAIEYLAATGGITIGFSNSIVNFTAEDLIAQITSFQLDNNTVDSNGITDLGSGSENIDEPEHIFTTNAVTLTGTTSNIDDYYNGQIIKVTRKNIDGTIKVQTRRIIGYDASEKRIYVGDFSPVETTNTAVTTGTTYKVKTAVKNGKIVEFQTGTNMSGLVVGDVLQPNANVRFPLGTSIASIVGTVVTFSDVGWVSNYTDLTFYRGADDTATVVEPKPWDFIPLDATDSPSGIPDSFEIIAEGDKKVSINPAIQLLDYLTNERFGRGLDISDDTNLETFKQTARLCDTRSDVTLTLANGTYSVGQKWQLVTVHSGTDYFQWQGTIKTIENITYGSTAYKQVTFEDCIGKLVHKWFDWKSYEIGQVVYNRTSNLNKAYIRNAAGTVAEASLGTAITELPLELSTNSSTTAVAHVASPTNAALNETGSTWDRNPVIKKYNTTEGTFSTSGYSLYDSDDVKYWRYMGWQSQDQREVTRHQTNATIRTETPLFQNVNSFLGHFNGILRYSTGKYELDVESTAPTINTITLGGTSYTDPRIITADDIIGAISVDDAGLKGSANSVSVSIPDPQIRFDNRNVTFYKSEYLKEDRGIPKKKSVKNPFITNYFNARINAEQYLDQSRFSRKINFQMGPKGLLLLAGTLIKITYPRFNWDEKLFRISNLQIREDCLVQVTAEEHDDNSYIVEGKDKDIFGVGSATGSGTTEPIPPGDPVAGSLTATTNLQSKIKLSWSNNINFLPSDWSTEVWYNNNISFNGGDTASKLVSGLKDTHYEHNLQDITENKTYYYWIRHAKDVVRGKSNIRTTISSLFEPLNTASGVQGTASAPGPGSGIVYLYKSSVDEPTDDPSADSLFPTVTVALTGDDAGKITGVAASQGSAALTSDQVIDTNGAVTGWFTVPQDPTNNDHVIWIIAATASSTGDNDEILRAEWTEPVKFSGTSGLNSAIVELYQLTNSSSAPADPSGTLVYTFSSGVLATNNINSWSQTAASPSSNNQYLWRITAAAIGYEDTHTVPTEDWSDAIKLAQYIVGAEGASSKAVKLTANQYAIPFTEAGTESTTLTFTATPQNLEGTGTYKFEVDSGSGFVQKQAASTTATYVMAQGDEPASGDAHVVKVTMYDGGTAVATDSVSIYGVQDGSDALTIIFPNEAHVLPAANNGTVSSYAGSGTDIRIYRGATLLTAATSGTTANTFKASASGSNITVSSAAGAIADVLGGTPTNETLRYADHNSMTADSASITYTITVYDGAGVATTYTKVQSFSKSKKGDTGTSITGASGKKSTSGYLYYNTQQASPPSAPSATSVVITWATGVLTGGVIGSGATNWNQIAPVSTGGASTSKMYYVYWNAEQTTSDVTNNATTSVVALGSTVYIASNFTGLVRFNGTNAVQDGTGNGLSFGSSGTTTIDGGRITTGTVVADRISLGTDNFNLNQFINGPGYLTSHQSLSSYATTSALNTALNSYSTTTQMNTALGSKADASGNLTLSGLAGQLTSAGVAFEATLTEKVAADVNTEAGGGTLSGTNIAKFQSAMGAAGVTFTSNFYDSGTTNINSTFKGQLTSVGLALTSQTPFATATTDITAGRIVLENNNLSLETSAATATRNNSIVIEATNNANRIVIYDGTTPRVIIGKLS